MAESKYSVLIVDADSDARQLVSESLHFFGGKFLIIEAEDTKNAINKCRLQKFDLIILDINLPKQDGTQILQHFKNTPAIHRPRLVIFTERPKSPSWDSFFPNYIYQKKPCPVEELRASLGPVLVKEDPRSTLMTEKYLLMLTEAAEMVFPLTASVEINRGNVSTRAFDGMSGDISATCEFRAPDAEGSFALVFPEATLKYVIEMMYSEKVEQIPKELYDVADELASQLSGICRKKLHAGKYKFRATIPKLRVSPKHSVEHLTRATILCREFQTAGGTFHIEASMTAR